MFSGPAVGGGSGAAGAGAGVVEVVVVVDSVVVVAVVVAGAGGGVECSAVREVSQTSPGSTAEISRRTRSHARRPSSAELRAAMRWSRWSASSVFTIGA